MEKNTYHLMRQIEDSHWWFVARRKIIETQVDSLDLPAQAQILEIGCGTGGNIALLNRFGEVTCVESNESAAKMAEDRKIAPVHSGKLPHNLPEFPQKFDVVTLFDVLEHIKDDEESLKICGSLLKPGGRIILTVPAFNYLWSQHDDENHHQRRYRRQDLVELTERCGLSLNYVSYFNFWLFPVVAAIRLFRTIIPYKSSWQDMRPPKKGVNKILQTVLSSERYILKRSSLPFGVSLIAVISI